MLRYGNAENVIEELVREVSNFAGIIEHFHNFHELNSFSKAQKHVLYCNRCELPLSLWKKR